jgi:hypothetical protein
LPIGLKVPPEVTRLGSPILANNDRLTLLAASHTGAPSKLQAEILVQFGVVVHALTIAPGVPHRQSIVRIFPPSG